MNEEIPGKYQTKHNPAYQVRFVWTGWFHSPKNAVSPPSEPFWEAIRQAWETDGIRLLEKDWQDSRIQILFSTKPNVSPQFLAARSKGRLQYFLRKNGFPERIFSRKIGVHSLGDSQIAVVEKYILNQAKKEHLADPRFQKMLSTFTRKYDSIRLSEPVKTRSGRYWYNLHIVLVYQQRSRIGDENTFSRILEETLRCTSENGHGISVIALLPDHLHLALKGNIAISPAEIVENIQKSISVALGNRWMWGSEYYVGTIGYYTMDVLRKSCFLSSD